MMVYHHLSSVPSIHSFSIATIHSIGCLCGEGGEKEEEKEKEKIFVKKKREEKYVVKIKRLTILLNN